MTRPILDRYFMEVTKVVATRSTCQRHNIGAIAVKDKRILSTGYNGAPAGTKDCLELGCLRNELGIPSGTKQEICRAIHAEQNVIIQAALYGVSLIGATIYCTHSPCRICAKMLANCKIERFVFLNNYSDGSFEDLFSEAGIQWENFSEK